MLEVQPKKINKHQIISQEDFSLSKYISAIKIWLWCLMPLLTVLQLYRGSQLYIGGGYQSKRENH